MSWQDRTNYGKHKTWIQHKNKKDWVNVEGMVESKYTFHLRVMNRRTRLTGKRSKPPSPRITEVRILETSQSWIPKPIPTSRAGALTWEAKYLTLGQEHPKSLPEQWRNWSDTSEQRTVTSVSQLSWLKPRTPSPTHRFRKPYMIRASSAPKQIQIWLTSRRGTSMKPSAKIWGRRISTSRTCTRSTISS